jgi:hypothetical protein
VTVQGTTREVVRADIGEECDVRADDMLAAEAGIDQDKRKGKIGAALGML